MTTAPRRGGFRRPLSLSLFIRDYLSDGKVSWASDIHRAYKEAAEAIPLSRGKGKRKVCSVQTVLTYLSVLRRLGLVEYVTDAQGNIAQGTPQPKAGGSGSPAGTLAPTNYLQAVPGGLNDPGWQNIWEASK